MSTSGVLTEVDRESVKPARRVKWIGWDSGFRDSGLRVGDRIAGDGGETYTAEEVAKGETIGGPDEGRRWRRLGLDTGSTLAVEAERGGETVRLEGRLLGNRTYRDAEGRRSFGEDGPAHGEKDGFEYAWSPWYSQFQDFAQAVLGGWDYVSGFDSRRYAERLEPFRERVVSLKEKYPGAFARAARHDFDEMARILAGERTELSAADLEYRQLGELRAARVRHFARAGTTLLPLRQSIETYFAEDAPDEHSEILDCTDSSSLSPRSLVGLARRGRVALTGSCA